MTGLFTYLESRGDGLLRAGVVNEVITWERYVRRNVTRWACVTGCSTNRVLVVRSTRLIQLVVEATVGGHFVFCCRQV